MVHESAGRSFGLLPHVAETRSVCQSSDLGNKEGGKQMQARAEVGQHAILHRHACGDPLRRRALLGDEECGQAAASE